MAVYNTDSDSANTAVRAFLTKVGEYYLEETFNTTSSKGKKIWEEIKLEFEYKCAYCGVSDKLEIEHLIMFNREECGLHHPGNIVPICKNCNKSRKKKNNKYISWDEHLKEKCTHKEYNLRKNKIEKHISKYEYPKLTDNEIKAIKVIANSLYDNIKNEVDKSLKLYKKLDEAFIK